LILLTFSPFPFINKLMAIRRCPYCKAIIDESQKYCNNCGTQLLFPEDELIEEDIPGEKIVDLDFEDKDELEPSPDFQEEDLERKEIDLEEVIEGGGALPGDEDEEKSEGEEQPLTYEVEEAPEKPAQELVRELEEKTSDEEAVPSHAGEELPLPTVEIDETGGKAAEELKEPAPEPTVEELEKLLASEKPEEGRSQLDEQEEIARIIAALERKQKEEEMLRAADKVIEPASEEAVKGTALETKQELPVWAEGAKTASEQGRVEEKQERAGETSFAPGDTYEFKEEVLSRAEEYASPHTGVGLPESVTQAMPFTPTGEAELDDEAATKTAEAEKLEIEETPRPQLGIVSKLRALVFDLGFILVIWAISLVLASRIMSVPIPKLASASAVSLVLFYLVLVVAYFFLFLFFLGETLGDRLVSAKD
jgi:hypothetical protein